MIISEFLTHLHQLGIQVETDGNKLQLHAPKGVVTTSLRQELATRKPEILAYFEAATNQSAPTKPSSIPCISREELLSLSFAQERFWLLSQLEPDSPAYNIPFYFTISGPLKVQALEISLNEVVQRHEVLRTTCPTIDGKPVLRIATKLSIPLKIIDLRDLASNQQKTEVHHLALNAAQRPFDFVNEPFLRTTLLWLDSEEYVLLITLHHFVADGWAMSVLSQELSNLYEAFSMNKPSPLIPLPIQFVDFAHYEKERINSGFLDNQLAYWKESLEGFQPLELPTDHPRPAIPSHRGATYLFKLPTTLSNSLLSFSRQENVTLFITLLSAFKVLLHRYTQQDDIILATAISNRNQTELEGLMGSFANNLLLRTQIKNHITFRQLLQQVQQVMGEALNHQDYPFEGLVESIVGRRGLHQNAILRVMFNLHQKAAKQTLKLDKLFLRKLEFDTKTSPLDISLSMVNQPDSLTGSLTYSADLFEASTIERMAGHFQTLLEDIVTNPEAPIFDLPLLTKAERHQLLEWNDTATDYPRDKCIHQLFEKQVERTPRAIALIFGNEKLTYYQLNSRANQLAHHLFTLGLKSGEVVGVCLPRSFDVTVTLLAIFKLGGIYLPLDPGYPPARQISMLSDAGAVLVLTTTSQSKSLHDYVGQIIYIDSEETPLAKQPVTNLESDSQPDEPAYIIYTSGSTGQPKGALVPHKQLLNRLHWMWKHYPFEPNEMSCQKTALSFVDSLWELLGPLLQGSPTVILSDQTVRDPVSLIATLQSYGVTRLWVVPTLLQMLLDTLSETQNQLPLLKFLVSSGEILPTTLYRLFQKKMPHCSLYNLYGTSEIWDATWYKPTSDHLYLSTVSVGKPIDNVETYILDEHLNPVPIGVTGELCVGGAGLAEKYLNRPELTATKFIPHPLKLNARLYRSGDRARYLHDGNIEFVGRKDNQVKIRGFRIELGEIENALNSHPAVREAVVMAKENEHGDKQLVAYVVCNTTEELRADLARKLPNYMLPSFYIQLDNLPLTHNGKIDRRALPEVDMSRPTPEKPFVAPRSIVESQLADIWAELLNIERVGIHDNFFELGGHSLKATQVVSRIRDAFQIELSLRILFERPTAIYLAQYIETLIAARDMTLAFSGEEMEEETW